MNQILTTGIVLVRTNYEEADRILTLITPDNGKLRVLARGVRKSKSKLAGGVELFSVSEIGYIRGRGELCTLTSSRLINHYSGIARDIDRTMLGYELLKLLNKVTEDHPESEYFQMTLDLLEALDNEMTDIQLVRLWFYAQLLRQAGHTPNLLTDIKGNKLSDAQKYIFGYDDMSFTSHENGNFGSDNIKLLRLVFGGNKPTAISRVSDIDALIPSALQLVQTILPAHIRI